MPAQIAPRAVIVLAHEVTGVDDGLLAFGRALGERARVDIDVPVLFGSGWVQPASEGDAYNAFMRDIGIETLATCLVDRVGELRRTYSRVYCVGFSVGATAAWLALSRGIVDAAVCVYGSRIRKYMAEVPGGPCAAVFAALGESFDVARVANGLRKISGVEVDVVEARHGFCRPVSPHYDQTASDYVLRRSIEFLMRVERVAP